MVYNKIMIYLIYNLFYISLTFKVTSTQSNNVIIGNESDYDEPDNTTHSAYQNLFLFESPIINRDSHSITYWGNSKCTFQSFTVVLKLSCSRRITISGYVRI